MLKTRDLVSNKRICLQGAYKKSLPPGSLQKISASRELTFWGGRQKINTYRKWVLGFFMIPLLWSAKAGETSQWWEVQVRVLLIVRVWCVECYGHSSKRVLVKCRYRRVSWWGGHVWDCVHLMKIYWVVMYPEGSPCSSVSKESACSTGDQVQFLGGEDPPGEGNGNPLQYASHTFLYDVYPSVK